jgi:hypothetical protein
LIVETNKTDQKFEIRVDCLTLTVLLIELSHAPKGERPSNTAKLRYQTRFALGVSRAPVLDLIFAGSVET